MNSKNERFLSLLSTFKTPIFLSLLFLLAFFLRVYLIPSNLFFGPEQGRDLLVVKKIVTQNSLTLIGPKTDIEGVFHGPLFYYITVIPFMFFAGNPVAISVFFIFINSLTVILIYLLGKEMFTKQIGIFAAVVFAISFEAVMYARWLSNPPLSLPLSCLFFLFFYRFLEGKSRNLLYAAIVFGLLAQVQFLNLFLFFVISIVMVIFFYKQFLSTNKVYLVLSIALLLVISIGTFILFDLRHNFLILQSLSKLIAGSAGYHMSYVDSLTLCVKTFLFVFLQSVGIFNSFAAFLILLAGVVILHRYNKKQKKGAFMLFVWVFIPVLCFIFLRQSVLEHYFIPVIPGFVLLASVVTYKLWQHSRIAGFVFLLIIVATNFAKWSESIPSNKNISFQSTQLDLRASDQVLAINTIYKVAKGQSFSFQAYTIPYWSQQGWQYLFWYYGEKKYGYYPVSEKAKLLYVIIQDDPSNKKFQEAWLSKTVSKWGIEQNAFTSGALRVKQLKTIP